MSEFDWKQCKTNRRGDKVLWAHEVGLDEVIYGLRVAGESFDTWCFIDKATGKSSRAHVAIYDLVMPNHVEWWLREKRTLEVYDVGQVTALGSKPFLQYRVELDDEDNVIKIERVES